MKTLFLSGDSTRFKKSRKTLLYGCVLLIGLPLFSYRNLKPSFSEASNLRTEVPLTISYANKTITPVIDISINHRTYQAVFDSGSSGIRILSGALKGQVAEETSDERVKYGYGDGKSALSLRGDVFASSVSFGGLKSNFPVRMMRIDSAKYGPDGDWMSTGDSVLIHSSHLRHLSAIMGVGLRLKSSNKGIANPFAQLPGNGKFIVKFPGLGGTKGSVVLNPAPQETAGFILFHLEPGKVFLPGGYSSWLDNELNGCFSVNGNSICQQTMLDCGSPNIQIYSPQFSGKQIAAAGSQVVIELNDKNNPSVGIKTSFLVSQNRQSGKDYVALHEIKDKGKTLYGTQCFFEYDVLYDQKNGVIGLRKKS